MLTREQIIQKLGVEALPQEAQQEQLENFANTVQIRAIRKIGEKLNDSDMERLSQLIDEKKDDEIEAYIKGKIPNYDEWVNEIQENLLNNLENNRKAIDDMVEAKSLESVSTD